MSYTKVKSKPRKEQWEFIQTQMGLSSLFETGTVFGEPRVTKVFGMECYAFRIWLGNTKEKKFLRQVDAWYAPVETSKQALADCMAMIKSGVVVAVQGARRTYCRYDAGKHALISVQVNIAESIAVMGTSDKAPMIEPILENLRATDRMMMDADEEEIDEEKDGSED